MTEKEDQTDRPEEEEEEEEEEDVEYDNDFIKEVIRVARRADAGHTIPFDYDYVRKLIAEKKKSACREGEWKPLETDCDCSRSGDDD